MSVYLLIQLCSFARLIHRNIMDSPARTFVLTRVDADAFSDERDFVKLPVILPAGRPVAYLLGPKIAAHNHGDEMSILMQLIVHTVCTSSNTFSSPSACDIRHLEVHCLQLAIAARRLTARHFLNLMIRRQLRRVKSSVR